MEGKPAKVKTLLNYSNEEFKKENHEIKLIKLDSDLRSTKKHLSDLYFENFENEDNVLKEAINVAISINNLNKSVFVEEHYAHTYIVLSANVVNLLLGIKDNLHNGLPNCAKILFRPLIEAIHVFQASLYDEDLKEGFMNLEMYDNNNFYFENFSKGKLFKKCTEFYKSLGIDEAKINYLTERNKSITKFLSESVHSSYNAAFSSFITATIDYDISDNHLGKITLAYPKILSLLIEEIVAYNTVYKTYIEKNKDKFDVNSPEFKLYNLYSDRFDTLTALYLDDFFAKIEKVNTEFKERTKAARESMT